MKARHKFRFYPTPSQQQRLAQLFGCVRFVWNNALAKSLEKYPGYSECSKALTQLKKEEGRKWLNDVSSVALQQSLRNLDKAYKNYFDSVKGKRKGLKISKPNFKRRSNAQSAVLMNTAYKLTGETVYLAKIGYVKPIWSRKDDNGTLILPTNATSVTILKDAANRYFLSFVVEVDKVTIEAKNQGIGIDLGLKTFAVGSDGSKAFSPNYKPLDRSIRKQQKKLARQSKGSSRREKTRLKVAKLHAAMADKRLDFLHKLSIKLARENQTIVLEDLNVKGMMKNRKLSRAIGLQGWGMFRTLTEAKAEKYDRDFKVINRFEPTSQICSDCGYRWGKLDLSTRTVTCLNCLATHDRDENAAQNILKVGIGHCHDSKCTQRDYKTTSVARLSEA